MALVNEQQWPAIYGNHEIILLRLNSASHAGVFEERQRFADLWWTLGELRPEYLQEMSQLPAERRIALAGPPIRLLHGLPDNPFEGFVPEMSDTQIAEKAAGIAEPVVVSAHTHKSMARFAGERWFYNPGSVGMPYNGDPRAQYLLLDLVEGTWQPTFCRVEYDRSLVREAFDRLGLFRAYGPLGPLYWQTIHTGDPWVSDFQVWVREQAPVVRADLEHAVALYLSAHGPGKWAFSPV
jgi:predicted phosphodiesterase